MKIERIIRLVICISFCLSSYLLAVGPRVSSSAESSNSQREDREHENIVEAKKILAEIAAKNNLLALELAKLPEVKNNISGKEVESLRNKLFS